MPGAKFVRRLVEIPNELANGFGVGPDRLLGIIPQPKVLDIRLLTLAGKRVSRFNEIGFTGTLYFARTASPAATHAGDGVVFRIERPANEPGKHRAAKVHPPF